MTLAAFRSLRVVAACIAMAACQSGQPRLSEPVPATNRDWSASLLQADREASAGRYAAADRVLADFTTRYPASGAGAESMYWRAIYKLDPANQSASPREATVLLEGYLASTETAHRTEALTLRRLATALESRAGTAQVAATIPPRPEDKVKDEELQRLKDELAKANAELDRIRKRVASPKP